MPSPTSLAALKAERASVAARGRQIETEAAPIRSVTEVVGTDTDSERAIRWLIRLMLLCCDRLAIASTAVASAGRSTTSKTVPSTFDSCRDDAIEYSSG
jgi:hypothetical protein